MSMAKKTQLNPMSLHSERGAALVWAVAAVAVASAAGVYLSQRASNDVVATDFKQASENTEIGNVSNLALMKSLVRFPTTGGTMDSRDPAYIPTVYPDPYIAIPN